MRLCPAVAWRYSVWDVQQRNKECTMLSVRPRTAAHSARVHQCQVPRRSFVRVVGRCSIRTTGKALPETSCSKVRAGEPVFSPRDTQFLRLIALNLLQLTYRIGGAVYEQTR